MSSGARIAAGRAAIVAGIEATPGLGLSDELRRRLKDPASRCRFDDLGLDSLGLMELCIFVEIETGVAISVGDVTRCAEVDELAAFIAAADPAGRP